MGKITEFEKQVNQRAAKVFNSILENKCVKNQSQLAFELGTHPHIIRRIYNNVQTIQNVHIQNLLNKFSVNVNYLLGTSDEMYNPILLQSKMNDK